MIRPYGDLVESISNVRFTPVRIRDGYQMSDVDELLDRIVAALGRGEPVAPLIEHAQLGQLAHVRLREGYAIDEVDAFLADLRRTIEDKGDR